MCDLRTQLIQKLRKVIDSAFATYSYENAAFFADKLVALDKTPAHVLLLARSHFFSGDPEKALNVLQKQECVPSGTLRAEEFKTLTGTAELADCVFLAAKCLEKLGEWVRCLTMLGTFDPALGSSSSSSSSPPIDGSGWTARAEEMRGAILCMAARCNEEIDRRKPSRDLYEKSLEADPYHWTSYWRCADVHLPTEGGEKTLNATGLRGEGIQGCIRDLYSCKLSYWAAPTPLVRKYEAEEEEEEAWLTSEETLVMPEELRLAPLFGWDNAYILSCRAERLYYGHHTKQAHGVAKQVLDAEPYHASCCAVYAAALVALRRKTDLFQLGQELSKKRPTSVLTLFVVGCYYFAIEDFDRAGKYYYRTTMSDPSFLPALIAYGHTFLALEEGEHTITAYRNVQRLFPGCHLASLYMGMEHLKSSNLHHAHTFLKLSRDLPGGDKDPVIHNELGVVCYKGGDYEQARVHFTTAIGVSPAKSWAAEGAEGCAGVVRDAFWEPSIFNLAHTLRKLRRYDEALRCYFVCLAMRPHQASILTAVGFTYHLMCRFNDAVRYYHMSLSVKSNDTFTRDVLNKALMDSFQHSASPRTAETASRSSPSSVRPSAFSSASPQFPGGRLSSMSRHWDMIVDSDAAPSGRPSMGTPNRQLHFPIQQD